MCGCYEKHTVNTYFHTISNTKSHNNDYLSAITVETSSQLQDRYDKKEKLHNIKTYIFTKLYILYFIRYFLNYLYLYIQM